MKFPFENRAGRSLAQIFGATEVYRRRALRGPDDDGQGIARQAARRRRIEAGSAKPFSDLAVSKAETAMGVLVSKKFERMWGKIDHDQDPVRPQNPSRLGDGLRRTVGIMQHLMDHDRVERRVGQRQAIHVPESDRAVSSPARSRLTRATASISRD